MDGLNLILVGGDDELAADIVRICGTRGHVCTAFADAGEALKVYGRGPQLFDAVILDGEGAEDHSLELLRKIRTADAASAVMVLLSPQRTATAVAAVNERVQAVIWKPVNEETVNLVLSRREEELEQQQKNKDEQTALIKEYIKLKRDFGEAQVLLRKYETLLSKDSGN